MITTDDGVTDHYGLAPGRLLHVMACKVLAIDPGHGSQAQVAEHIGVSRQQYGKAIAGLRGSLETLSGWAGQLGLRTIIEPDGQVWYDPGPLLERR